MSQVNRQFKPGEQTEAPIDALEPHPANKRIYVNDDISGLVQRMETVGFIEDHRITIDSTGRILKGHRRWRAAKEIGLETVPVEVVEPKTDAHAELLLITDNDYREKWDIEKYYEMQRLINLLDDRSDELPDLHMEVQSKTKEELAELVGLSSGTMSRLSRIVNLAESGDSVAKKQVAKLEENEITVGEAYARIKTSENRNGGGGSGENSTVSTAVESADGQNSETSDSERTESSESESESESEHIQPDDSGVSVDEAAELLDGAKPTSDGAVQDGSGPAAGDPSDPDEESDSQRVTELEALLEARNDRIEELETRLRSREEVMLEGGDATIDALGRIVDELDLPIDAETHPPRAIANRIIDTIERLRADRADLREQVEAQRNQLNEFEKRREEIVAKSEQLIDAIQDKDPRNVDVYAEELEGVL